VGPAYWAKDWAKLLMNATLLAVDCLPRGGTVRVTIGPDAMAPSFRIEARGTHVRVAEDVQRMLRGEAALNAVDARGVQPFLTHKLSRTVNAGLLLRQDEGVVEVTAG
jgi:histidine phosphotransferase ChpT